MQKSILNNYTNLIESIKDLCKKLNRNPNDINIVAVSKGHKKETVKKLLDNDFECFGENRLEEALIKWEALKNKTTKLHFIGALQSKKVKKVMSFFNVIETLDTESSAKNIAKYFSEHSKLKDKIKILRRLKNYI